VLDSAQVAVVRRLYEARGNPEVIRQVLAPDVRWEVVEGFPYSGVYVGLDDVLHNFFGRLFQPDSFRQICRVVRCAAPSPTKRAGAAIPCKPGAGVGANTLTSARWCTDWRPRRDDG
jgi:hypothetical protein